MVLTPLWGSGGQDIDFLCVAQKISLDSPDDVPKAYVWMQTIRQGGSSAFGRFGDNKRKNPAPGWERDLSLKVCYTVG